MAPLKHTDVLQLFANTGGFSGDFASVISTGLAEGQAATFATCPNQITRFSSATILGRPLAVRSSHGAHSVDWTPPKLPVWHFSRVRAP